MRSNEPIDPDYITENVASTVFESAITDVDSPNDNDDIKWLREQRLQNKDLNWFNKPTVAKLCFALLVYFVAMSLSLSSKVILMLELICNYAQGNNGIENCHDPVVQELASSLQLKITFVTGLTATLVMAKIGEVSDRFGRKRMLIFIGFLTFVNKLVNLWIYDPKTKFKPVYFIVNAVIENLGGGMIGILTVANSYITDIVQPHERIVSLGFSNGTMYAGMGLGPLVGGVLIYLTGNNFVTLYCDIGLAILYLLIIVFLINESRSIKLIQRSQSIHTQRRESFQLKRDENRLINRVFDIFRPLKLLLLPKHKTLGYIPRINVILLIVIESMLMLAAMSYIAPLILYVTYEFNWNSVMISYFIALSGTFKTMALYLIGPTLQHFLRMMFKFEINSLDLIDLITISIGSVFELISPLIIVFTHSSSLIYSSTVFSSLSVLAIPTLQSSIIKYFKEDKSGEVFSALGLIKNLIIMVGPSSFLFVYSKSVDKIPVLVFVIALLFISIGVLLTFFLKIHVPIDDDESVDEESLISVENDSYVVLATAE